ncbi:MAG: hypothetical protein K0R10_2909 [Alphaproteobacteria bacterium]|jgi:hypothetical protein|nr:hypothetical protein [Alphaproteobacteria bacterium]
MTINFKKSVLFTLFAAMMTLVSVTSAQAVTPCTPRPGCSCDFLNAAENHANAVRVRDKAYHRQIVKQPDNTMGMTCFDHTLVLSSRLGQIFSDTTPGLTWPAANLKNWDPTGAVSEQVYDPGAGVGTNPATGQNKALSAQYGHVFGGEVSNHATNFADSLSAWLGATLLSYLNGFLAGLNGIFAAINGFVTNINNAFNTMIGYINTIQNILDQLGAALPSAVVALVAAVQAAWTVVQNFISATISAIQTAISGAVTALTNMVQGVLGSLLQFMSSPGTDPCARIKRLWNPASISSQILSLIGVPGFRPIEGGGIERGAPYFDFANLVNGTFNTPLGGAIANMASAVDLTDELSNTLNQPLLTAALNDLAAAGILGSQKPPGAGVIWPQIPGAAFTNPPASTATIGATVTAIINGM